MYQCVNKIWYPPLINVWIKYDTHHLSMCEQNMVPTMYQCIFYSHIDTWWVPYFVHTLIHGGYHILFTHWYMVGTIFYSHIDTWWVPNKIWYPPCINVWIKYGTHHLSMCEQNMVPTMYQYVNKIWHPPRINVVPYFIHTLIHGGYHILFTHWYVVGTIFCSHIDTWWVPYFIHTLIRGGYHILFTHWYVVGTIFYSHIDTWWYPPRINVWIKYGTHHVSMCE
jgi:hypothetical protein